MDIDGTLHVDSTDIAHALEDCCDEAVYFIGLHPHWIDTEGAPQMPAAFGGGSLGWLGDRFYRRRITR
jgi:hypothetical protein